MWLHALRLGLLALIGYKVVTRKDDDSDSGEGAGTVGGSGAAPSLESVRAAKTSPRFDTLEAARRYRGDLTLDEYTLARVINSEFGSGSPEEMLCIGDADLNKAAAEGRTLHDHATRGNGYGAQGEGSPKRPVSSARAPGPRHVEAALALTRGGQRGISRGAVRYLDPKTQLALSKRDLSKWCPPAKVLEKWTFNADWSDRRTCTVGKPGPWTGQQQWVGPIPGVRAYELMLLRPATTVEEQRLAFSAALAIIAAGDRPLVS